MKKKRSKRKNEEKYIDDKLKNNEVQVDGDVLVVDGWQFEIDRNTLEIVQEIGKHTEFADLTRNKAKFTYQPQEENVEKVDVSVEIEEVIKEHRILYKIGKEQGTEWVNYTQGTTFEVRKNTIVYGRIVKKETNEIGYQFRLEITNIDKIPPQEATIDFDRTEAVANETIQATVRQKDDETGIDISNCKYIANDSKEKIGITSVLWENAENFTLEDQTINIKKSEANTYYLHVLSTDLAGNRTESVSNYFVFKPSPYLFNQSTGSLVRNETVGNVLEAIV